MSRNRTTASSSSSSFSSEIPSPSISTNYEDNTIKFHFKTHGLITIIQLIFSTLCLFYIPQQNLLKDPVESLKSTNLLLFFVQFIIETIRWLIYLYYDSSNSGYETRKNSKVFLINFVKNKGQNFIVALLLTAFAVFVLHIVAILFGASLIHNAQKTLMFAVYVSLLGIFPPAVAFKNHTPYWSRVFSDFCPETIPEKMVYYPTVGTIIGAWAGAIVIPLDWDRPWQEWPISCVISAYIGHVIGSIIALIVCYFNPESSTLQKKRE
ncbi:unnamed protein product [Rhizophagus irregularis]|nr:unnamed protein product [Rhizophagus irregularis]CAB4479637.1 unnamed protein product [Rhizophagus irregularis]